MARDVVTLRLDEAEKDAIAKAAAKQRLTLSEFLRQAALLVAFRLSEERREPPPPEPEGPAVPRPDPAERHVVTTYSSFGAYRAESPYAWS